MTVHRPVSECPPTAGQRRMSKRHPTAGQRRMSKRHPTAGQRRKGKGPPMTWYRIAVVALLTASGLIAADDVGADSIYLMNGRVIHTESVRIEGGNVIFRQYGGTVSIPRASVLRIERDATSSPPARRAQPAADPTEGLAAEPTGKVAAPGAAAEGSHAGVRAAGSAAGQEPPGESATGQEPPAGSAAPADHPWETAAYWLEQLAAVDERIERVEAELARLPVYSELERRQIVSGQIMYFAAQRDKWEAFRERLQAQRRELERSARKAGILPGVLREARRQR